MTIKTSDIRNEFLSRSKWVEVSGLPGNFSATPDKSPFMRIFCADVKLRSFGRQLLGVIGYTDARASQNGVPIINFGAYITNFVDFINPPILSDRHILGEWIDRLYLNIERMPDSPLELISSVGLGKVGPFPARNFVDRMDSSKIGFLRWLQHLEG